MTNRTLAWILAIAAVVLVVLPLLGLLGMMACCGGMGGMMNRGMIATTAVGAIWVCLPWRS